LGEKRYRHHRQNLKTAHRFAPGGIFETDQDELKLKCIIQQDKNLRSFKTAKPSTRLLKNK
jgi:hypothetical protein